MIDLPVDINTVEAVWITINLLTLVVTIYALGSARADQKAVAILNGHARELSAFGQVRREFLRLIVQVLLLGLAIPGLFSDRDIDPLNPFVDTLILISLLIAISSVWDARDRKVLTTMAAVDLIKGQEQGFARIEHKLDTITHNQESS